MFSGMGQRKPYLLLPNPPRWKGVLSQCLTHPPLTTRSRMPSIKSNRWPSCSSSTNLAHDWKSLLLLVILFGFIPWIIPSYPFFCCWNPVFPPSLLAPNFCGAKKLNSSLNAVKISRSCIWRGQLSKKMLSSQENIDFTNRNWDWTSKNVDLIWFNKK